jgi:hypothetical protein
MRQKKMNRPITFHIPNGNTAKKCAILLFSALLFLSATLFAQNEDIISYFKNEGASRVNDDDPDDDVTFVVIKVK